MVQFKLDLGDLCQPHTNLQAWIAHIRAHHTNKAWCSYVGKIHRRQHAHGIDILRRRVHAIAVTKDMVKHGDAPLETV
eukprot:7602348-Karenia_brevis.AAC.1